MTTDHHLSPELGAGFVAEGPEALPFPFPALRKLSLDEVASLPPMPYADPLIGARLLLAHLDTNTDEASRRPELVDAHVAMWRPWLPRYEGLRVLHPACGPGLIADALTRNGLSLSRYVGIDVNPASVAHARARLPAFDFRMGDIADPDCLRTDGNYDLALLTYESVNLFRWSSVRALLVEVAARLAPDGVVIIESRGTPVRSFDERAVRRVDSSLFMDGEQVLLDEWVTFEWPPVVAVRRITIVRDERPIATFHSVIWTHDEPSLTSAAREAGLDQVAVASLPEAESDVRDTSANFFVAFRLA